MKIAFKLGRHEGQYSLYAVDTVLYSNIETIGYVELEILEHPEFSRKRMDEPQSRKESEFLARPQIELAEEKKNCLGCGYHRYDTLHGKHFCLITGITLGDRPPINAWTFNCSLWEAK